MPRFFFHLHDGTVLRDEQGIELESVEAAKHMAISEARAIAAHDVSLGKLNLRYWIEVEDDRRRLLFTLPFSSAVYLEE